MPISLMELSLPHNTADDGYLDRLQKTAYRKVAMKVLNSKKKGIRVQALEGKDRRWAAALLHERWGSARIVSRGQVHEADQLLGFVAWHGDKREGLLTYRVEGLAWEIVSLDSLREGIRVGIALLGAVREMAIASGCTKLWLVTTNDNSPAIDFYQSRGFALTAVHKDAVTKARELKPEIPMVGYGCIPIRDEFELEIRLDALVGS
ncbi:MAG: GNAT family N-acetyltransferase [Anaerolineales bacterium]|nr:GNAT family N-acetyltransferase [Anaerolineales bacterium]